jgi:hypothetical protein
MKAGSKKNPKKTNKKANKQTPKHALVDNTRIPKFEPDPLLVITSRSLDEEKLIDEHLGPPARYYYEVKKRKNLIRQFRGDDPSPERFLQQVKIIVASYVAGRKGEGAYHQAEAKKELARLNKALSRSLSPAVEAYVRDWLLEEITQGWDGAASLSAAQILADDALIDRHFYALSRAVRSALQHISPKGAKPKNIQRTFVRELAFAWCSLAGEPPPISNSQESKAFSLQKMLHLLNEKVIPPEFRSENNFESYVAEAARFAKSQYQRVLSAGVASSVSN